MPQVKLLKIFLASPSDVAKERDYVVEVINEINSTIAPSKGVMLQVVRSEENVFPGYNPEGAQAELNAQIANMEEYALFVGIMWNRVGTPTPRAESGTIEEFERAVKAFNRKGQPQIWFYFRQAAAQLDTTEELEQKRKVLEFKERIKDCTLFREYKNPSNFRDQFRNHIVQWLNKPVTQTPKSHPDEKRNINESNLWDTVLRYATNSSEALQPHILRRIDRPRIESKCIDKIRSAIQGSKKNIIPILGSAGYGKTTILGKIFEERDQFEAGWVALARCDDILVNSQELSWETIDAELGETTCGEKSFIHVSSELTRQKETGVLLLDTLDLLLSHNFVKRFRQFLLRLEGSCVVVFTCRDQDYEDYLQPYSDKLPGLADKIAPEKVYGFNEDEIETAVLTFIKSNHIDVTGGNQQFIDNIKELSADNRSLREITSNPLLLALLCDLFASEGRV
ncbi:MAG: hypothetical protein F6J86_35835 [Symploca sp. SIO1B1]|nr:hypothetical protein [Symploca sp. SIO1B1]